MLAWNPLQPTAPPGELARSQRFRHASDEAMAERCAAAALFALDDNPTIEKWMGRR